MKKGEIQKRKYPNLLHICIIVVPLVIKNIIQSENLLYWFYRMTKADIFFLDNAQTKLLRKAHFIIEILIM